MRARRGTGYLHRPPTLTERASSSWRGARIPSSFEPAAHPPFLELFWRFGPLDQGKLNACTGFAVAMGATIQSVAGGAERAVSLSPMLPYWAARRREWGADELVKDEGAYVDDIVWAFNAFGALDDFYGAYRSANTDDDHSWRKTFLELQHATVNKRPAPEEFRAALRTRSELQLRMRSILAKGPRLAQRLAHSLHLGQVCFVALPVGPTFLDPPDRGAIPEHPDAPPLGYHFVCLLDWRLSWGGAGGYELLCGNSWGADWGDGGTAWLSPWLLAQSLGGWYLESVGP